MRMAPKTPKPGSIRVSRTMGVADAEAEAEADEVAEAEVVADALRVLVVWMTVVNVVTCEFEVVVIVVVTLVVVSDGDAVEEAEPVVEFEPEEDCAWTKPTLSNAKRAQAASMSCALRKEMRIV